MKPMGMFWRLSSCCPRFIFRSTQRCLFSNYPQVVYQDNDYIFLAKYPGIALPVVGLTEKTEDIAADDTFHESIKLFCRDSLNFTALPIFSIDKVASGLVVYAKNREAEHHFKTLERNSEIALAARAEIVLRKDKNQGVNEALINQAGLPLITQTYLALVRGCPKRPRGQLNLGLLRKVPSNRYLCVARGGKITRTNYSLVVTGLQLTRAVVGERPKSLRDTPPQPYSLLSLRLSTQRRHQARAICSHLGCAVVGDREYGGGRAPFSFLHSTSLSFISRDGSKLYQIGDAPLHWTRFELPNLSQLVENLNAPKVGSLSSIYNSIVSGAVSDTTNTESIQSSANVKAIDQDESSLETSPTIHVQSSTEYPTSNRRDHRKSPSERLPNNSRSNQTSL